MSIGIGRIPRTARSLAAGAVALLALATAALADGPEADRIRATMRAQFERPDSPLLVEPVIVVGDHAVAGWRQGELGGRAVLRRENSAWTVFLCGGDALKNAGDLQDAGIPASDARTIARDLAAAEAKLPAGVVAKLGTLKVLIPVGAPPSGDGQAQAPGHGGGHQHGGHGAPPPAAASSR